VGTDRHDDGIWLAAFSSRGPTVDGRTKPDITAPGVSVRAAQAGTGTGYITYSGTSMATPFVAGAVALALEAAPTATPAQVRAALMGTAQDVGATGQDNEWGAGLVDVRAFVDALTGATSPRRTAFPSRQRSTGVVPNNGYVDVPVVVGADGLGVPLAATVTIAGHAVCYFGCLIVEWSPDLDVELRSPDGAVLATSDCALDGLSCGVGRQETVGIRPTVAGTYVVRIKAFTGSPNNGAGGAFVADIFHGPAGDIAPPPPTNTPPVANAGPDQSVTANSKTGRGKFTLDGSSSSDPDGDPLTYKWTRPNGTVVGTTAQVTLKRAAGTWTFRLTVSDGRGGSATDSVVVVVHS
jgi:serine protease AprX